MLRKSLIDESIISEDQLIQSPLAEVSDILKAHGEEYVTGITNLSLDHSAVIRIGFPLTQSLVKRSLATVGGAIAAAKTALECGISGQLAGGTHHAHRDFGSGYCVFNDFAVVCKKAIAETWVKRIAIIDLDVHQGDGNATILEDDKEVFVFSLHGEKNFPFRKATSSFDYGFAKGAGDEEYLSKMNEYLQMVWEFEPELVLYQAGVDALEHDNLGHLNLTFNGLAERDRIVLSECKRRNIPLSMAIGGGYSKPIEHSVTAYINTYKVAKEIYGF